MAGGRFGRRAILALGAAAAAWRAVAQAAGPGGASEAPLTTIAFPPRIDQTRDPAPPGSLAAPPRPLVLFRRQQDV